jgi:hypothetical protein
MVAVLMCFGFVAVLRVGAQDAYNLTGLPLYPNLTSAQMDGVTKTDAMGHWCMRFAAETFDSLDLVQDWYRRALPAASETDLNHDERYNGYTSLIGIKLAFGIDSVTVFRAANQSHTSIELFKCSQRKT